MNDSDNRSTDNELKFTGERFVTNLIDKYIVAEHYQRYNAVLDIIKGKKVLDAACGAGYGTALMATAAEKVTGIDISAETIAYAQKRYAEQKNASYVEASIAELPFEDHSFDVIVSFETIEHVTEELQDSFLKEIKRCLKEDGLLIMSSPDKRTYTDLTGHVNEFHIKEFYVDEFENFLKREFKYCQFYLQGEQSIAGEIIHPAQEDCSSIRLLNKVEYQPDNDMYVIALCSNQDSLLNQYDISNVFGYRYVPTVWTFENGEYDSKNIIQPCSFEEGAERIARFDLSGNRTEGKIRFAPLENACCSVELMAIDTDATDVKAVSLNHVKQDGNKYTYITIGPAIELSGNFSSATYLEIRYRLIILDARTVGILSHLELDKKELEKAQIITQKTQEIDEKNQIIAERNQMLDQIIDSTNKEIGKCQNEIRELKEDLERCQYALQVMTNNRDELIRDIEAIKSTKGYKAIEELRAIRHKLTGK